MKSSLKILSHCLLTLLVSLSVGNAMNLVKDGTATAKIYVSPKDLVSEDSQFSLQESIDDFNYHLKKISGTELEIVQTDSVRDIHAPALILGTLAAQDGATPKPTRWQEGYRIVITADRIAIAGETPQATAYGLYDLLRELGVDWVMPGVAGEVIPSLKTIAFQEKDVSDSPDFGYIRFWYNGGPNIVTKEERAEYAQWKRRHKLGTASEFKDGIGEGHFWDALIRKYKERFDANPEMLALVQKQDGEIVRSGPQIETTNPEVIDLIIENIRNTFTEKDWSNDKKVTLPIGPADGGGYSISQETMAIASGKTDPLMGGADVTDVVVKLANDVLEKIGGEFPNLSLSYYVYSHYSDYPTRYKPNPRIYPVFAPITYSRLHSTNDPHSKTRAYYRSILEQWAQLAKEQHNRFMVYEYNWNLADNLLPFTRIQMLGEDIPFYHKLGFEGVILESIKAWGINGAGDYIAARLAWDTSLDWKALLHEYCEKAYGDAAPEMERYFLGLAKIQSESGQEAGSYYSAPLIFTDAYMESASKLLETAKAKKGLTEQQRLLLSANELAFSTLQHYLQWNHAMSEFDFAKAQTAYEQMQKNWQSAYDLDTQFVGRQAPRYLKGLIAESMEQGLRYSTKPNRILQKLPDALPTALDPTRQGERLNLAAPEINDSGWIKTQTFGSTWDAQGLGFYRDGTVWYRFHFTIDKTLKGQPVGLFLGGFEDEARVWLNGKPMGSSGIKFANPAVFDLTDAIRSETENVLAIQIIRNSNINENLLGGLFRPSFLFTGPRVETPKPASDPEYRILPGGGKERLSK